MFNYGNTILNLDMRLVDMRLGQQLKQTDLKYISREMNLEVFWNEAQEEMKNTRERYEA